MSTVAERSDAFAEAAGRRPRILIAAVGQDGQDRNRRVSITAFADLGFDVDAGPPLAGPEEVALQAVDNDVHVVGISCHPTCHLALVPALRAALAAQGRADIGIVVIGVTPASDIPALLDGGAWAVVAPDTGIAGAAGEVLRHLRPDR